MPRWGRTDLSIRVRRRSGVAASYAAAALAAMSAFGSPGVVWPGASFAATYSAGSVREAADAELANPRYQTEFPVPPKAEVPDPADDIDGGNGASPLPERAPPGVPRSESMGEAAKVVVWALIGIGVLLLVVYVANELPHLRRRRQVDAPQRKEGEWADMGSGAPPRPAGPLDEADGLAREGAYGAAIHLVLLALVDALHGPIGRRVARSLTGREVVGAAALDALPGEALSRIVAAAERSHFGGRPSSRTDYESCRADYARVLAGLEGPA